MTATEVDGSPIRVLLVDDQALVRTGFRLILEIEPDIEVVGEAADGATAVRQAGALRPDVVLMDVRMPLTDGIEATRQILAGGAVRPRVVMLTTFDMEEYVYRALEAGASGFLLKDALPERLVDGIRAVHAGESLLAPSVTRRVIATYLQARPAPPAAADPRIGLLTVREKEVLGLVASGLSNAEIATTLFVSETTVKTHVSRLLTKLGLRDRVQAVIWAFRAGVAGKDARG